MDDVERKKQRFREFLKVMGKGEKGQSWNDNFEAFMEKEPEPTEASEGKEEEKK
jgi:hypothetical protein